MSLPRDVLAFLNGYPGLKDRPDTDNLDFYRGRLKCRPDRLLIDDLHRSWSGRYDLLERKHGFIQWLFPIRELGVNYESQPLQMHELAAMKDDDQVRERFLQSYRLMLDFYGMQLVDPQTGELARKPGSWQERYDNLRDSSHNNLRISRILKALGEMRFDAYPAAFVLFVLAEQSQHQHLNNRAIRSSMDAWWINCNRNKAEREEVNKIVGGVREGTKAFTLDEYKQWLVRRQTSA